MMFRNVREKYDQYPFTKEKKSPNPYYEKYLGNDDHNFLDGYDWAVDEEIKSFFGNILDYLEGFDKEHFLRIGKIDEDILLRDDVSESELKDVNDETVFLYRFKEAVLEHLEIQRNEMVTSMIDNTDEDEYNENYKKVWGKYPDEYDSEDD